jgi:nucleoside-diphosphate-sugar epimerase
MHTILGSGGAIGVELAKALTAYSTDIRLVSRNPKKVNATDTLFPADLTSAEGVMKAVEGSTVCYLTLGFDYKTSLWQEKWPVLIQNVVAACVQHKAKLVFFDNVYALAPDQVGHITEESVMGAESKKGKVREYVDRHILEHVKAGKLEAIIARAPDFFGPIKDKSLLMNLIYDNLLKGKASQWFCNADVPHSSGFTPDLAKGTAILGNTPDAFNQIWNLPCDPQAPTGREWVKLFVAAMGGGKENVSILGKFGLRLLGIFIPILKEMVEMTYQYDRPYVFDSSKFNKRFGYTPTSNAEAVKLTVAALKK